MRVTALGAAASGPAAAWRKGEVEPGVCGIARDPVGPQEIPAAPGE
jgi:hypothetical protein